MNRLLNFLRYHNIEQECLLMVDQNDVENYQLYNAIVKILYEPLVDIHI